jgi:hypothetical protein
MQDRETVPQLEREWRDQITANIRDLADAQRKTAEALQSLKADMMPRGEITHALSRVVSQDTYDADTRAHDLRFQRLENGPTGVRGWLGVAISLCGVAITGGGCLMSSLIAGSGVVLTTVLWILTHK